MDFIIKYLKQLSVIIAGSNIRWLLLAGALAFGTELHFLPMIAMPLIAIGSIINSEIQHSYEEKKILNIFRDEIAATLHKNPYDVTIENLHTIANGSPALNIEGNPLIWAELDRNDKEKSFEFGVHIISAIITIIASFTLLGEIGNKMLLMLGAGAINSSTNIGLKYFGKKLLVYNVKSDIENIAKIEKQIKLGHELKPEKTFEIFANNILEIATYIEENYDKSFYKLSPEIKQEIMNIYEDKYHAINLTNKINSGYIPASEIAFAIFGKKSAIENMEEKPYNNPDNIIDIAYKNGDELLDNIDKKLAHTKNKWVQRICPDSKNCAKNINNFQEIIGQTSDIAEVLDNLISLY